MAEWLKAVWKPSLESGLPRRDRRGGAYATYVPDHLVGRPFRFDAELSLKITRAERAVQGLSRGAGYDALEGISRFLLRSEAIASSMIEGIAPSPQQVAIAELAQEESVRGFSDQARLVANNITILQQAAKDLVAVDLVTVDDVVRLHQALLPEERHHGLRRVQNWIGGSNWHPLDADFVPPPPDRVVDLMADLVQYLNGSAHAPLVQLHWCTPSSRQSIRSPMETAAWVVHSSIRCSQGEVSPPRRCFRSVPFLRPCVTPTSRVSRRIGMKKSIRRSQRTKGQAVG